jgi:molecular chaperone DnaK
MKSTSEELTQSMQKIGEQVYRQAQGAGAQAGTGTDGAASGAASGGAPEGDVVDADFKEV